MDLLPWCDICNDEVEGDPKAHAFARHQGEGSTDQQHSIEELGTALQGHTIDRVEPLKEGEGGICVLHLTKEGNTKRVFLRSSIGFWFSEVSS